MSDDDITSHTPTHSTPLTPFPISFKIDGEIKRQYRRFNAIGTELTVRLSSHPENEPNPMSQFKASVTELIEYVLRGSQDSDMVGLTSRNEVNV